MTEIRFYHMTKRPLEAVLPALLGKALESGHKILIRTADARQAEFLNEHLWTFSPDSFIPHGTHKDGPAALQPVFITENDENPNGAGMLVLTGGTHSALLDQFTLCCDMLDGRNPEEVAAGRERWKTYKDAGHSVTYWQQNEKGGWDKKA